MIFCTVQLKALAVDDSLAITHECSVVFEADLPEFRCMRVCVGGWEIVMEGSGGDVGKERIYQWMLSSHSTSGGVIKHSDGRTVTAPTLMWVKVRHTAAPNTWSCDPYP